MHNSLRRLDLNLLVTLDALLAELNVTRAARRLNLAQPTVSLQLGRLRQVLEDPLLLPGPRGMRPTARAEALREPLRQALAALEDALAPAAPFEPARAERTWRIAASDHSATTLLTPLLADLRQFEQAGFTTFHEQWPDFDLSLNRTVRVETDTPYEGVARGIENNGALIVESAGQRRLVHAGDVSLRLA